MEFLKILLFLFISIELPLNETLPKQWCALPEYFIEDIADFVLFLLQ